MRPEDLPPNTSSVEEETGTEKEKNHPNLSSHN